MTDKRTGGPWDRIGAITGHLDYYVEHAISPVSQDLSDIRSHLERRRSLYRGAGLLPAFFAGSDVLEVAPGSGHNSLYIASCLPAIYDLCEPNPSAVSAIYSLYSGFELPHTAPVVHSVKLEEFCPDHNYDVVICEGWLGSAAHELSLLEKLAGFVRPGGVLVVTTVSPIGILSNLLRKLMAQRLIDGVDGLEARTAVLMDAFSPHLATLASMSRPHRDWIQDNILNPAYYGVCLTPAMIVERIGARFSIYGTAPRIATDWRWHKSLHGENLRFNENFLESYYATAHNFVDHTVLLPPRPAAENRMLENECWSLIAAGAEWERAGCGDTLPLIAAIEHIADDIRGFAPVAYEAINEFHALFRRARPDTRAVAEMGAFGRLFGRENLYVSLCRDG
jgi:2-polyprenyl-3-methyl-5-hydroxy-6-metoxy-1,4-benzoquinol methylase